MRTDELCRDYDVSIRWTVFPLHPEIPDEGLDLGDLFAGRNLDIDAMMARLHEVAKRFGLPLGPRRRTFNSRRAQELAKWADEKDRGDAFRAEVFRAYFAEGRNIARPEELGAMAQAAGLSSAEAIEALGAGAYRQAVESDWARSRAATIRGVPAFRADGRTLVGLQDREDLAKLAEAAGARRRPR